MVEEAREQLAELLGAQPVEVIFTSGGTEADNLAVKGSWWARRPEGRHRVAVSAIEHHAVLDPARWLVSAGAELTEIAVSATGRVAPEDVAAAVDDRTAMVSVMWANNEVGTVQPVAEIADRAHRSGRLGRTVTPSRRSATSRCDFGDSGARPAHLQAHKLGGPYGVGALLARREVALSPLLSTAGARNETSGPARWTWRRSPGSPPRSRPPSPVGPTSGSASRRCGPDCVRRC